MKKKLLTLILLMGAGWSAIAQHTDTLHYYNPNYPFAKKADPNNVFNYQMSRFVPKAPGILKKVNILFLGDTGVAKIQFFGHEGGWVLPVFMKDMVAPIWIHKTDPGEKRIEITLPQPMTLTKNQFFVGIDSISPNMYLGVDTDPLTAATCSSEFGGNQWYLFERQRANGEWVSVGNPPLMDAIVEYPVKDSPNYLKDTTMGVGMKTNFNSHTSCADYNNDGYIDILKEGRLYKNLNGSFTDVTIASGMSAIPGCQLNAFVDMNNDGFLDIIVVTINDAYLFTNTGSGNFTGKTLTGLPSNLVSIAGYAFADINKDNFPDLLISQGPANDGFTPEPSYLLLNNKTQGFDDASGILFPSGTTFSRARGCSFVDFDNDGDMDLYIANYRLDQDNFFINNNDGTFTDACAQKQIDVNATGSNNGTGVDWADYDNDGDMDLLLPQLAHPQFMISDDHRGTAIYRNEGAPNYDFTDITSSNGIEYEETHGGATWGDVNNDGLTDFFISTYYECRQNDIYLQQPDHTFKLSSFDFGIHENSTAINSVDGIWADFNNDGLLDLACAKDNDFKLYYNQGPYSTNKFVKIKLKGIHSNSQAIGAKVSVYAGNDKYTQEVNCGRGQNKQRPYTLHFGLGNHTSIDSVVVRWPNSFYGFETFKNITINSLNELTEGNSVGINTEERPEFFSVFPVPGDGHFTLSYQQSAQINTANINVYTVSGELAYSLPLAVNSNDFTHKFDLSLLSKGYYMLELKTGQHTVHSKLVIH